jgi:hypothetical protein
VTGTFIAPPGTARRVECDRCAMPVVVVELMATGVTVVLDADEVLPPTPCPLCRLIESRGQRRGAWCWRCGGTGVVGSALPEPGVAIDKHGHGRIFQGKRRTGEAVHRLHPCGFG